MAVKSLKQLLDRADEFIKNSSAHDQSFAKEASAEKNEVEALVDLLTEASAEVSLEPSSNPDQAEMDKVAESLNRLQTAAELEELYKLARFSERAFEEGYSEEQIQEAFSKIAAARVAKNLPLLGAMGVVVPPSEDKNSLPEKPSGKTQGKLLDRMSVTKSVGY